MTGPGYDGHTFWDTERFVLPVLTYTAPRAAADALRWRHSTLDLARQRAAQLGLEGAAFPWRTIRGQECSGYWPAGTAAFHIGADIADAVVRYQDATADEAFELGAGLELLVETARFWRSLGHHDAAGRFRIDGVTGPDEYSAIADNNVYTNLMAQRNLAEAADAVQRHPRHAAALGADFEEAATWRHAAENMIVPWDESLGVHPQSEGFTDHRRGLRRHQPRAVSAADPLPLLRPLPQAGRGPTSSSRSMRVATRSRTRRRRDFAYYEALTVRDSSLSACTQAMIAAEVGHLELAYDYFGEAALMDLHDVEHNTLDGVHIASLAGAWIAAVAGFGGMRDHDGKLTFAPRLPPRLVRLTFRLTFRGSLLKVEVTAARATYEVLDGPALALSHHGEAVTVSPGEPLTLELPPAPQWPAPTSRPDGRRLIAGRGPARDVRAAAAVPTAS